MHMIFLGTSAGEMYPGIWCRCPNCEKARQLGGKNIRRNSAAHIEPNTLIDFPPEIVTEAALCGVDLTKIEHLLITHPHADHFFPWLLGWRYLADNIKFGEMPLNVVGPRFSALPTMHVYGNQEVCDAVQDEVGKNRLTKCALKLHPLQPFEEYQVGDFTVTPVKANHSAGALNYILQKDETTLFYGLDTGWFLPETYGVITSKRYDLVVLEGTFGLGSQSDGHFNFEKLKSAYQRFCKDGLLKENSVFVTSHLCPHHTPVYDEIAPVLAEEGITVAYDGMSVEIK